MNDYIYKLIEIKSKFISNDIKVLINNIIDLIKNYKIENNLVNINDDTNKDKEIIKKLQEQLDLLKEENIQLKDRINYLENDNKELRKENIQLKDRINYLENDNKELRKENIQLKDEIKILNNKIVYLKNKDFINKLLICFQDLNREYLLEKLFNYPFYKYIYRIRNCRMNNCHYLEDGEDINILKYKKYILYNILQDLDNDIIIQFEKTYKCIGLINKMIEFTSQFNKKVEIEEDEKEYIDIWWNE